MDIPKKDSSKEKIDSVQEPLSVYEADKVENLNNSDELHPVLVKLIDKSKKNHQEGLVFSQEEVMEKIKLKYPFLK
jgi:hypothetical protein